MAIFNTVCHLGFLKLEFFSDPLGLEGSMHQLTKFTKSSQTVLRYRDFMIFQDGGRPPSWFCLGLIWSLDHPRRVLSGLYRVQNLVAIDAVVSMI